MRKFLMFIGATAATVWLLDFAVNLFAPPKKDDSDFDNHWDTAAENLGEHARLIP